jgi:hypothetical protein
VDNDKFSVTIRNKKKLIREKCKHRETKIFLLDQVEICEALDLPLTEEYIVSLVAKPLREVRRMITLHKGFL